LARQQAMEAAVSVSKDHTRSLSSVGAGSETGDVSSTTSEYAFDADNKLILILLLCAPPQRRLDLVEPGAVHLYPSIIPRHLISLFPEHPPRHLFHHLSLSRPLLLHRSRKLQRQTLQQDLPSPHRHQ
jgi:hypothetical protein